MKGIGLVFPVRWESWRINPRHINRWGLRWYVIWIYLSVDSGREAVSAKCALQTSEVRLAIRCRGTSQWWSPLSSGISCPLMSAWPPFCQFSFGAWRPGFFCRYFLGCLGLVVGSSSLIPCIKLLLVTFGSLLCDFVSSTCKFGHEAVRLLEIHVALKHMGKLQNDCVFVQLWYISVGPV